MRHAITLIMPTGEYVLEADEDEYILDVGRREGLDLPSTCLQGWCLSCSAYLDRGEVDQSEAFRYFQEDRDSGFILLCSAKARSDLRIRTGAKEAMIQQRLAFGLPTPRG